MPDQKEQGQRSEATAPPGRWKRFRLWLGIDEHVDWGLGAVLAFMAVVATLYFFDRMDDYTRHFGAVEVQAVKAKAAQAASEAAGQSSSAVTDAKAAWGQYGDYMGGILNPVLSFFSFLALAMTLMLQARQVSISRTELRKAEQANRDAADAMLKQLQQGAALVDAQMKTAQAQAAVAQAMADQATQTSALADEQFRTANAQRDIASSNELQALISVITTRMHSLTTALESIEYELKTTQGIVDADFRPSRLKRATEIRAQILELDKELTVLHEHLARKVNT